MGFQRKQITLPDTAGETVRVDIKGFAVIIESINLYSDINEVPLMYFDSDGTREQPLYPQSKYASANRFKRLVFKATDESAGDAVDILVTDACIEPDINVSLNLSGREATLKATFTKTASDSVQSLSSVELQDSDGNLPTKMYVQVSTTAGTKGIKYAFDSDPVQGDDALGGRLDEDDGVLEVVGINFIEAFNFIAGVNTETPVINFTLEY